MPFKRKLILNQWLLGLFGVERFDQLAEHLKDEALEGLDENNIHRRFLETHGRTRELNRIILLTPNEGLSQQHLREFEKVGSEAEIFNKDGRGLFAGQAVEILEVTKLKEEMGAKTVAVDAFEGNNLLLVDEGHRGASAGGEGAWMSSLLQLL